MGVVGNMQNDDARQALAGLTDQLFNQISKHDTTDLDNLKDVLIRVNQHIDSKDPVVTANRLANYIYFVGFTDHVALTQEASDIVKQIAALGKTAGVNGSYRAWYSDSSQF